MPGPRNSPSQEGKVGAWVVKKVGDALQFRSIALLALAFFE